MRGVGQAPCLDGTTRGPDAGCLFASLEKCSWSSSGSRGGGGPGGFRLPASPSLVSSRGPVLAVAMGSHSEYCYSGGADARIHSWKIPDLNMDPYDGYGEDSSLPCLPFPHPPATRASWFPQPPGFTLGTGGGRAKGSRSGEARAKVIQHVPERGTRRGIRGAVGERVAEELIGVELWGRGPARAKVWWALAALRSALPASAWSGGGSRQGAGRAGETGTLAGPGCRGFGCILGPPFRLSGEVTRLSHLFSVRVPAL